MYRHPSQLSQSAAARDQRGIVLVTGLVFLGVLTVLGVTAMQSTNLEERMAGNLQKRAEAFQRAEGGLEVAREFVANGMVGTTQLTQQGPLYMHDAAPGFDDDGAWSNAVKKNSGLLSDPDALPNNTRFYVERHSPNLVPDPVTGCTSHQKDCMGNVFVITVRGLDGPAGQAGHAEVFLRSRVFKE